MKFKRAMGEMRKQEGFDETPDYSKINIYYKRKE
jgi:hypothetical protein